jgi:hypothetical protein
VCRTTNKFDESLGKLADLADKLGDDTVKLEKTTSHLIDMMKDEKGNGDDDIWI